MPPLQRCCCKDGEEPCPNCWEKAMYGCSVPCCWCDSLEGLCEGTQEYTAALNLCRTTWEQIPSSTPLCPDTFTATVGIPDYIQRRLASYGYDGPVRNIEKVYDPAFRWLDRTESETTHDSVTGYWITNRSTQDSNDGICQTGTGTSPPGLPDSTNIRRACPAASYPCTSGSGEGCTGNSGQCCKCSGGIDDCTSYLTGYNFGIYNDYDHFEIETTTLWSKQVESVVVDVAVDTRADSNGGCSPCCYTGLSSVVATGHVKYLGLRNMVTAGFDTNCPSAPWECDCNEEECQPCLHCQATNSQCLTCNDKYCINDNPEIGYGSVVDHADFDVYDVPINWRVRYELKAIRYRPNSETNDADDRYAWNQRITIEYEADWSGITVDPATQSLRLATAIREESFSINPSFPLDCWKTEDFDTPCLDCSCTGESFLRAASGPGSIFRGRMDKKDPSDLSRCDYWKRFNSYINFFNICPSGLIDCGGTKLGRNDFGIVPIWKDLPVVNIEWEQPYEFFTTGPPPGTLCYRTESGSSNHYTNLAAWLDGYTDRHLVACTTSDRTTNCGDRCATQYGTNPNVEASWEDLGFVVTLSGLGSQ